ncbi:MAG: hypothetical protein CMO80_02075 [Verrucomicrobiales bacterium]|nr:hypothetical protein [Verrucomicrobiales bacterium]|tara:strand:- start:2307 stop:3128 length:822 start_codon:yes stop_codon:yes gene_type:complete
MAGIVGPGNRGYNAKVPKQVSKGKGPLEICNLPTLFPLRMTGDRRDSKPIMNKARFISRVITLAALVFVSRLQADTLLLEVNANVRSKQIDIPEKYSDLNESFDKIPGNGDFRLRVIVPNFEKYAKGTHTIELNVGNSLNYGRNRDKKDKIKTPGLAVSLFSKMLGNLEGVSTRVPGGRVVLPDETQLADIGTITIKDGAVTGFKYGWVKEGNPGTESINRYLVGRKKFPVRITSITVDSESFSPPKKYGDLLLVSSLETDVKITMKDAKADK